MKSNNSNQDSVGEVATAASGKEGALAVVVDGERTRGKPSRAAGHLNGIGIAWSSLCALHCAAPLVLTGTALLSSTQHEHTHHNHADVQLALAGMSVAVAGVLLGRSYLLQHRDPRPLWILAVAVTLLALGRLLPWSTEWEAMTATSGGFLALVTAQVVNVALLRRRRVCCVGARSADSRRSRR